MSHLRPKRHPQGDLFIADILDAAPRDDLASMEHPLFALRAGDKRPLRYENKNGVLEVQPGYKGRATIHDKDILIYCISQLVEAMNRGREISRTIDVIAYDLLVTTNRRTDGDAYKRLQDSLDRLRGTGVSTNIKLNGARHRAGFGLISDYEIVEYDDRERMSSLQIVLSEWLFQAVESRQILSISRDYFRLRKPLDRRIYELCRKHCGYQRRWRVSMATLHQKTGSMDKLKKFRAAVRSLVDSNQLPDYRITYDSAPDMLTAYPRSPKGGMAQLQDAVDAGAEGLSGLYSR